MITVAKTPSLILIDMHVLLVHSLCSIIHHLLECILCTYLSHYLLQNAI